MGLMDDSAAGMVVGGSVSLVRARNESSEDCAPHIVGYRFTQPLGRGGQGHVFQAIRLSDRRKVAIKVILPNRLADAPSRARFEEEWRTLSRLHHPSIVRVLDHGKLDTGEGLELFLVEAKSTADLVIPSRFTSLGLGRGGLPIFERNLLQVETAIRGQVSERALREQLLQTVRAGSSIRLVGPQGFRVTQTTVQRLQNVTGRNTGVITLP